MSKGRTITALLLSAVLLSGTLSGCGTRLTDMIDAGAERYAQGKPQEDYHLEGADRRLDHLMEHYSGSFHVPTVITPIDGMKPPVVTPGEVFEVGSEEELTAVMHKAYAATATQVRLRFVNGYSVDLWTWLPQNYAKIRRADPISASGLGHWWPPTLENGIYIVNIQYQVTVNKLKAIKKETPALVKAAAEQIRAVATTDYERVCGVNKYLMDTVIYPEKPYPPEAHTAYSALKEGIAVCDGYSTAAMLILRELGMECDLQSGVCTNGQSHAWNLVCLDGKWYQLDITWNDADQSETSYFLVTDTHMRFSRTWNYSDYPKTPLVRYRA